MKSVKVKKMTKGIPSDNLIAEGAMTPQEVLIECLKDNLDEFREAQRRIDAQRRSR